MSPTSRNRVIAAVLGGAVLALVVAAFWLAGRPTRIGSEAYDYATALHSICHQENPDRLRSFVEQLEQAHSSAQISSTEFNVLRSIAQRAEAGGWKSARARSRKLLEDQVEKGRGRTPAAH